jgi:hypothetical protein
MNPSSLRLGSHLRNSSLLAACALSTALALAPSASALCIDLAEDGVWYNSGGDSPYEIEVQQGNCEVGGATFLVDIWERQSSGELYHRGRFPANYASDNDGSRWIKVTPYSDGGYLEHPWLRRDAAGNLRVWIYYESLDSKPDAVEDQMFLPTPPPPPSRLEDTASEGLDLWSLVGLAR